MASKFIEASSLFEAKVKALEWAISTAICTDWSNIIFIFDAKLVVEDVCSLIDPGGWSTKEEILPIRACLPLPISNACLFWNHRYLNGLVDLVVRKSFSLHGNYCFNSVSFDKIVFSRTFSQLLQLMLL